MTCSSDTDDDDIEDGRASIVERTMDFVVAVVYVLGVYVLLPMYFWGKWERQEHRRDPVRRRGLERIRRELARRERGVIDGDG